MDPDSLPKIFEWKKKKEKKGRKERKKEGKKKER